MSHDVDFGLERCDVALSFIAAGNFVDLFAYKKGTDERAPMARLYLSEWEQLTACVRENLTAGQPPRSDGPPKP